MSEKRKKITVSFQVSESTESLLKAMAAKEGRTFSNYMRNNIIYNHVVMDTSCPSCNIKLPPGFTKCPHCENDFSSVKESRDNAKEDFLF